MRKAIAAIIKHNVIQHTYSEAKAFRCHGGANESESKCVCFWLYTCMCASLFAAVCIAEVKYLHGPQRMDFYCSYSNIKLFQLEENMLK